MKSKSNLLISIIPILLLLTSGAISGCRHLTPEGVYKSDRVLYNAELATVTTKTLFDDFLDWEMKNRAVLAKWPEITKSADFIRVNAKQWFATAHHLRDSYLADPTQGNRDKLQTALAVIQTALIEANGYMLRLATQK